MDKIIIRDLLVRAIIGVDELERRKPQDILINVEMFADLKKAGLSDSLDDTISYSSMVKIIQNLAESVQRFTVEALAEDIARLCLNDNRVEKVMVRIEKTTAVRFVKTVGVEIERYQK